MVLLEYDVDINGVSNDGCSFLVICCYEGYVNVVSLLFKNGVEVNFCNEYNYNFLYIVCE